MLLSAGATLFVRIVFHILLCPCVTPPAMSLLTVAPLASRKNAASSRARQEGVVGSARQHPQDRGLAKYGDGGRRGGSHIRKEIRAAARAASREL